MNNKLPKQTLHLIMLFLLINIVSAANTTIDGLIDSFNYNFINSTVSISAKSDSMADTNGNGINDVLTIQLTTSVQSDMTLNFIVTLLDKNKLFINTTTKLITSSDNIVQIKFPAELLESEKFNYTIEINNADNELVYREYKTETNAYANYEKGTNITRITDENVNNNFIRINLTVNSTSSVTANVTVTLAYNSSTVSKTEEKTLSNGLQVISIDFDNETIKSTHYNSNFTISKVMVGNKIFNFNRNTSIYNYEDFAKTSYIKSIADGRIDTNQNNLSEFLEINFTINAIILDTYKLTYDLYDQFNNYVVSINKTQTLTLGNQIVQTLINGSSIYKTKIDGPYVLSFAKLAIGNDTKDIIFNAHTTNQSFYTDYERPPLPDLAVDMTVNFDNISNTTNITINLSNVGQSPSFNIILDLFDNATYTNNKSISFLSNGDSIVYRFNITNSSNTILYTAITDFNNIVDESNESNNIVQNTQSQTQVVSLKIESLSAMYSNGTMRIFEFVILNDGDSTVTDIHWTFSIGDGNTINSIINMTSLAPNERAFIYVEYNYSSEGTYNITANATGLTASAYAVSSISIGDLSITSFGNLSINGTKVIFEIQAKNNLNETIKSINWSLNAGDGSIISAAQLFSLQSGETIFIFAEHNYGASGTFNTTATVTNTTYSDTKTASVAINTSPTDQNKFFIKNSSGNNIAWFGDLGNIVIKGTLEQNSNFQATSNFAFKIRNNGNDVLIIENNGSMYIDGTLFENQAVITSDINKNDFRVKDSNGNLVININESGYVFLKGTLTQNGNP